MSNNRTVSIDTLRDGEIVFVNGYLNYSRLKTQIAGEELAKMNKRRAQNNQSAIDRPYTTATVEQASVSFVNPQNPTPEEIYIQESFYTSTAHPEQGLMYSVMNKGNTVPQIAKRNGINDNHVQGINIEKELAPGLLVTLVIRIFRPSQPGKKPGISLDMVIVNEEIRYYNNAFATALANKGLIFTPAPAETTATSDVNIAVPTETANVPQQNQQNFPVNNNYATPTYSTPAPTQPSQPQYNNQKGYQQPTYQQPVNPNGGYATQNYQSNQNNGIRTNNVPQNGNYNTSKNNRYN